MYRAKLCLGLSESQFGLPLEEQIRLWKQVGFDGFFAGWTPQTDLLKLRRVGDEEGMAFQSVHAPFEQINALWKPMDNTEAAVQEQIDCLRATAEAGVPIMVMHPFIGFIEHEPTQFGLENFDRVVREAERLGVKIAIENVEGEEYLSALMAHYSGNPGVGFCWDTGHEMCYNHGKDMLALYGGRLLCTHLNDNLGIRDYEGNITWLDDLHLLPFDGVADWADIAARLNRHGYDDFLTFELNTQSKPGRRDNDKYQRMEIREYIAEAYARACRVAALKLRDSAGK